MLLIAQMNILKSWMDIFLVWLLAMITSETLFVTGCNMDKSWLIFGSGYLPEKQVLLEPATLYGYCWLLLEAAAGSGQGGEKRCRRCMCL